MKTATVEEITKARNDTGLGLLDAKRLVQAQHAHDALEKATTVEELKPIIGWLLDGRK